MCHQISDLGAIVGMILLAASVSGCQRQDTLLVKNNEKGNQIKEKQPAAAWPPLPANGFIAGRAATTDDMKAGQAVFALGGQPLKIDIPQYAYHINQETKQRTAGIITQAELSPDGKLSVVGMRKIDEQGEIHRIDFRI